MTDVLRSGLEDGSLDLTDAEDAAVQIEHGSEQALAKALAPSLRAVINATGVVIHTNLGRAPLGARAVESISRIAGGYSNLEFDLDRGTRGHRTTHAAALLQRLTGAEAAAVVNNNAAAVLLTLTALAAGREVIISRGELVEIGGGFRIPDVLRQSGATLREVGTTNRTRAEDYAAAINARTALILRVHPSNFRIEGFAERPTLDAVVAVGRRYEVPVVEDLGSGNVSEALHDDTSIREPTVRASLRAGVSVCCFSGDKLLGGPQAGIVVGEQPHIDALNRHPLMRALRADKLLYAALEATLIEHLSDNAPETVPVTRMINTSTEQLTERAQRIIERVAPHSRVTVTMTEGASAIGGGTTPGVTLPSVVLSVALDGATPDTLEARLRASTPPVVGRIEKDRLLLDLRTVAPSEDEALVEVLRQLPG
jgi:L-seryl-tRNA(Ser) seleniumtransferase